MNEPYFVNTYNTGELMGNLNALHEQGYEIINITGHHNEKSSEFTVVAKDIKCKKYSDLCKAGVISLNELMNLRKSYQGTIKAKKCDGHLHYHQCCDICQKIQTKNDILKLLHNAYYVDAGSSTGRLVYICKIVREILEANCDKRKSS